MTDLLHASIPKPNPTPVRSKSAGVDVHKPSYVDIKLGEFGETLKLLV